MHVTCNISLQVVIIQSSCLVATTLQERHNKAEKALEEAKEELQRFESENSMLPDDSIWKILQERLESCRRT
jgi:hypothetical protein